MLKDTMKDVTKAGFYWTLVAVGVGAFIGFWFTVLHFVVKFW